MLALSTATYEKKRDVLGSSHWRNILGTLLNRLSRPTRLSRGTLWFVSLVTFSVDSGRVAIIVGLYVCQGRKVIESMVRVIPLLISLTAVVCVSTVWAFCR